MSDEPTKEQIKAAASLLGQRTSPAKTAAARRNIATRWERTGHKPCTCEGEEGSHKYPCPVYFRERRKLLAK